MKLLVIADIHGNSDGLAAVLAAESDADRTIFLGDAVLPGPQPNETIAQFRDMAPGTWISGNHDEEMLDPDIFAKFPAPWLAFYNWVLDAFEDDGFDVLRTFLPPGEYEEDGMRMYLHHGQVEGGPRHVIPSSSDDELLAVAHGSDAPIVMFGHSHVQFTRTIGGQLFINPGSVGQNRCGRQLACYGVFEDGRYEARQVGYDQTQWLADMDKIDTLNEFEDMRAWLKDGFVKGFGIGANEPWTTFSEQGYN
ncbi:MAG: hypothetical protein CMQ05_11125 [Gammaproteobacteria bacterium]|mgnify:FL=1|uniref:Calcineurin-like phosphoesterase domain-containing protein n=1 Tax=OM182 bacterium MED-G24 TaxID=1986255 RepID=A0A2A5WMX2_9GAMM|nr:hypothetical protein [Gammaproteobacteria bacterium]PDH37618.1 MAG: hypothetical protein CNE99_07950 [OM182 bacterium MED-G24]RPG24580.1 MAG: metallophosphoesterase [Gammaproteobacteria bacterium TMED50]|tara:strand:+ start:342 stop:1094 length:753 start_codon:yes stop_codon:yes gene_type:complete